MFESNPNFDYRIEGFEPVERPRRCGFTFVLSPNFAEQLRETPVEQKYFDLIQKRGREILEGVGFSDSCLDKDPYVFWEEGSLFLHYAQVPGNACSLILDRSSFGENTLYVPNNVDNLLQGAGLMALVTNWANFSRSILDMTHSAQ